MVELNVVPGRPRAGDRRSLPAMREPTIAPLHGGDGMAVKAAVPRSELPAPDSRVLKERGATDIVVSRLEQIVP